MIAFLVATLNDLDVFPCNIGNAYLNAPCQEQIWFQAGIECGQSTKGRVMKFVQALYGLKSSGISWMKMFTDFIASSPEFKSSQVNPDMHYRRNMQADSMAH